MSDTEKINRAVRDELDELLTELIDAAGINTRGLSIIREHIAARSVLRCTDRTFLRKGCPPCGARLNADGSCPEAQWHVPAKPVST